MKELSINEMEQVGGGMSWTSARRAMTSNDAYRGINQACVTRSINGFAVGNAVVCISGNGRRTYSVAF